MKVQVFNVSSGSWVSAKLSVGRYDMPDRLRIVLSKQKDHWIEIHVSHDGEMTLFGGTKLSINPIAPKVVEIKVRP